ncbi:hypothetical protein PLESTB_000628500 [Pleodorina starrii]|uniref:Uncharacterized protein n=1 Tax=Pleodorina starrii TaxID=330485 RepID=A0A9W6BIW5_9CHLO|nr:hypothetical protein PLESTB_000628500 [Pleodorina starrii]
MLTHGGMAGRLSGREQERVCRWGSGARVPLGIWGACSAGDLGRVFRWGSGARVPLGIWGACSAGDLGRVFRWGSGARVPLGIWGACSAGDLGRVFRWGSGEQQRVSHQLGCLDQAERLHRRVLNALQRAPPPRGLPDHAHAIAAAGDSALVLLEKAGEGDGEGEGGGGEAAALAAWVERALGPDHEATLRLVALRAFVLQVQGRWEEADELLRRVVAGREAVLGGWGARGDAGGAEWVVLCVGGAGEAGGGGGAAAEVAGGVGAAGGAGACGYGGVCGGATWRGCWGRRGAGRRRWRSCAAGWLRLRIVVVVVVVVVVVRLAARLVVGWRAAVYGATAVSGVRAVDEANARGPTT